MLEASPPIVQVVTAGPAWAALVAAVMTGVAAVAGIGATTWQAKRGIRAENMRAERAEKRRVYAQSSTLLSALEYEYGNYDPENAEPNSKDPSGKLPAALVAISELQLIAPKELGDLASRLLTTFEKHNWGDPMKPITEASGNLFRAVRADLEQL